MSLEDTIVTIVDARVRLALGAPRTVSQKTSEAILGLPRRDFLALVREFRDAGGDVIEAGKLRLVEADHFVRWLRERSRAVQPEARAEQLDEVDTYAAALGLAKR